MKIRHLLTLIIIFPLVAARAAPAEPVPPTQAGGMAPASITDEQIAKLAAIAPPPKLSDRKPGIHTTPCLPESVPADAGEVEGKDYYCGVFTVPQNWDEPDGRNLDLAFLVVKARGEKTEPDPLVALAGGPGASAFLSTFVHKYASVLRERDLILFDIRGVGLSQRINYEECLVLALQNGAPVEEIGAIMRVAGKVFLSNVGIEPEEGGVQFMDPETPLINKACGEQFTGQGLDLNQFSTAANARDTVEIVKALGYDRFNIDSVSYGTRLAMTIMNNLPGYPDAPELRSVILDSAFPPSVYVIRTRVRSEHDFLPELMKECMTDVACSAAYPDLSGRFARLLARLEKEPLTVGDQTVTLQDVVLQLAGLHYTTRAGYIPKMIAELETGVLETYQALREHKAGSLDAEEPPPDMSDPVVAFISNGQALLSGDQSVMFPVYVGAGLIMEDPLGSLQEIFRTVYPAEIVTQLNELLEKVTPEDVAASAYVAQLPREDDGEESEAPEVAIAKARVKTAKAFAWLESSTVHCIDDILHERFEDSLNSYNDLEFPQIATSQLEYSRYDEGKCVNWPVSAASIEVKNPVKSDIRTLILQSTYDNQTPVYMGKRADRELDNSVFVMVPQAGHGAWRKSDSCVGSISYAFLQDPDRVLDLNCLEARKPQWALQQTPSQAGSSEKP